MYFLKKYRRGIFNRYYKGMPLFEMLMKDISYAWMMICYFVLNGFRHREIFVYPHYPSRRSTFFRIAKILRYNISNKPVKQMSLAMYWEYNTLRTEYALLESLAASVRVINLNNRNISKEYVDKVFFEVFGYGLAVNPLTYKGHCVKKSTVNAMHDGTIVVCPLMHTEEGYVYQKVIDNTTVDGMVEDIRLPVVADMLPYVFLKKRKIEERFTNNTRFSKLYKTDDVLSDDEQKKILTFCNKLHLDFGELDVLRHKEDGRIYIVDVNNTALGPPVTTSAKESRKAMCLLAEAFRKNFLSDIKP